ncbi:MAG: acetylornithine deacetylase [Proteobacteria bacterium]|nr:acetylornithine deacetylase [Pseudomonadota bacterium]
MKTIEILDRLIAFDTVSHRSNLGLLDYVQDLLEQAGAAVTLIKNESGTKANLYATIGPKDRAGVLLSGHTDVVPVEGQDWTVPPFKLTSKDGRLYGRGTCDMKGFLASALSTALIASRKPLKTPLHLAFSYDEEIGCIGVRSLIDMLKNAPFRPLFCIVGEPTNMAVATGHKGKTALHADCIGKEAHSALAPTGMNAIHLAADFVTALRAIQADIVKTGIKDADYDVPYTTVHVGKINGGLVVNIVPNLCTLDFEIRSIAQDNPDIILAQIRKAADKITEKARAQTSEVAININTAFTYPGLNTPTDAQVVSFVKSLTGANGTIKVAFGTEGGLFDQELDIPTVICGPGSMAQGHKPDEYVSLEQLEKCDKTLGTLIDRLVAGL